jgi:two-component system phosphate regulon sensor histidine kinase PhoR
MQQQSKRMGSIVEDLLLLSQVENNEQKTLSHDYIDLSSLLIQMKKEAQILSTEKHIITTENDNNVWLQGELKELQSAFFNLITNAIRYTPAQGEIKIRWYQENDQYMCFSVQDSGEGIAEHHLSHLTERFYRIDVGRSRTTGGTGLGLAIVKHVMNHHNGLLVIESQLGQGSTFKCLFPINMTQVIES